MARTVEQILRDMIGGQAIQIAQLLAENETLKEKTAPKLAEVPKEQAG